MVTLTKSEKKVLAKIRRTVHYSFDRDKYMFWFVYDGNKEAVTWEGGCNMSLTPHFRNQYTIEYGKRVVKNWEKEND